MGWAHCGEDSYGREMGYCIEAGCDEKGCDEKIDRGLAYVCGGMHEGGEFGCGGYFCAKHRHGTEKRGELCKRCAHWSGSGFTHWAGRDTVVPGDSATREER